MAGVRYVVPAKGKKKKKKKSKKKKARNCEIEQHVLVKSGVPMSRSFGSTQYSH